MSLRLRLTLWYGALCALALTLVGLVGYTASVREQYLTIDRVLVVSARLVENGIIRYGRSYALETDTTGPTKGGIVMVLRSYSPAGELMYISPSDPGLPRTRPVEPLLTPAPPAYQAVLPWPLLGRPVTPPPNAAFGTMNVDQQRWRRYVVQVSVKGKVTAYVEALTPLGQLDAAALRLARLLLNLVVLSVLAVLLVGWWLAGSALRPVDRLNRAARAIAQSRDLRQRVRTTGRRDELGRLATTFNEMLGSLESAWKSQQRFVGDASHELRAPLTVMRGNLELLRRHPHLSAPEREDMLSDVDREAARLSRLVEDLLLLARSDAGVVLHKRPVDLLGVAQDAVRDARRLAPHHHVLLESPDTLDTEDTMNAPTPGSELPTVQGDPDRLKQLLLILLDNATKYSPEGSTVSVALSCQEGQVQVRVRDQGSGIPDAALPHIFERFYRADPARGRSAGEGSGGAGLGLAIARWIAEQLDGRLEVEATGPQGTTFRLDLPEAGLAPRDGPDDDLKEVPVSTPTASV